VTKKLQDFVDTSLSVLESYAAVFVPGAHGAMRGIPEDENVRKILSLAHEKNLFLSPFVTDCQHDWQPHSMIRNFFTRDTIWRYSLSQSIR
jgi:hypothetical protein